MDQKLWKNFIHGPPSAKKNKGGRWRHWRKAENSVRANWAGCVVGDDTKVAAGVPLGLGSWTPNQGTLVQLIVGDFQSLKPGLDRC